MPQITMRLAKWGGFLTKVKFMRAFVSMNAPKNDIMAMMSKLNKSKDVSKCKFMTDGEHYWVEDGS